MTTQPTARAARSRRRIPIQRLLACAWLCTGVVEAKDDANHPAATAKTAVEGAARGSTHALAQEPAPAPSPALAPDRIILSGRLDRFSSTGSGGGAGVSWLTDRGRLGRFELGMSTNRVGGISWHVGRFATIQRRGRGTVDGSLELGGGAEQNEPFLYVVTRLGAGLDVVPGVVQANVHAEYLDINTAKGWLVKGSTVLVPTRTVSLSFDYRNALSSALDVSHFVGRADVYRGRWRLLGGVATGTFLAQELLVLDLDVGRQTEWFAGVGVPLAENDITVVWSRLTSEGVTRHSVALALGLHLGGTSR